MDSLSIDQEDTRTLDRDFDAAFNPFPAELKVSVQGNILASEGFARLPERTVAVKMPSALEAVGMLDTRFEAYYEDVDFGVRCAIAGFGGDRQRLIGESFGANQHLVISSDLDADREIAARIGNGLPAEFFLGGTSNAQLRAGQRITFLGEDRAADQKIVGVTGGFLTWLFV